MLKIEKLTPRQKARFSEFVEKWKEIGLSTEPADRPMAELAIKKIYKSRRVGEPKIVWCTSPLASGLTRAIILEILSKKSGDSVWASVQDSVRASVWDSVWASVRDSVRASVRDSVRASVWDSIGASVWASVWASVRDSVWASVWASVQDSVRASVRDSVWASVHDSVRASIRASVQDSVRDSGYGQYDADWLSFYDYFRKVCGLRKQTRILIGHSLLASAANWYLPHRKICWVCERPRVLHLNERGRLHCSVGPALEYPDGWGVYALNGVRMEPEYVLTSAEDMKPEEVLKEDNVDRRRELLRKIGVERMMQYGKVIEEINGYKLIDMSKLFTGIRYAPHLLMRNPSLDDTWHLEGVGPECQSVQEAINWRAGNREILWSPALLS